VNHVTVHRLLIKRTHIFLALVAVLAFPAAAFAAVSGSDSTSSARAAAPAGIAAARVATLAPLQQPVDRFDRLVHTSARRIHTEVLAAQRQQRREQFADLPGGITIGTLESIAACESGGDPTAVSSDGSYRGKYQFDFGTWESVGGHGDPAAAPEDEQDYRAALLYSRSGSSPWPVCG
jgi:hypothetical protein